jgi:hypothetical protein
MYPAVPRFPLTSLPLGLLLACGGGGGEAESPDAASIADAPAAADDVGYQTGLSASVQLREFYRGGKLVSASVRDARPPIPEVVVDREGDCAIYHNPMPGLCEECSDGACTPDGICTPWPREIDAGAITISGLDLDLAFLWDAERASYRPEPEVIGDLFADGDMITVEAAGGDHPPFLLEARGVADLAEPIEMIELVDEADFPLRWTADGGGARIELALRVGWHGVPYEAMLLCNTADDGELDIPRGLIAQMPPAGGVGLFPWPSELTRLSRSIVEGPNGTIELVVGSAAAIWFTHD